MHSFMGPITDDVCLGDDNGRVDAGTPMPALERGFLEHGYSVVRNKVFTGGHIVKHYGRLPQTEALMVEVRYTTYLRRVELDKVEPPRAKVEELVEARTNLRGVFEGFLARL